MSGVACWNQRRYVYVGEILLKNGGAGRKTAGQETSSHLITRDFFVFFYFPGGVIEEHGARERQRRMAAERSLRRRNGLGGNYATAVPG